MESTNLLKDEDLEIKQIKKITANSDKLMENADKYIKNTFESLEEALVFMSELELRKIKQKISSTTDKGVIKKLNKILQKINAEIKKQKLSVKNSRQDYEIVIKNKIKADLVQLNGYYQYKPNVKIDISFLNNNFIIFIKSIIRIINFNYL